MSDGVLTVLDGTHLRATNLSPPDSNVALTGAELLDLADYTVSSALFGLALPQTLMSSALRRIGIRDNDDVFRRTELAPDQASQTIKLYIAAIADELQEDEDEFAMIAENLFTDLDAEDKGKIRKSEIRNALGHMGVEMGVPSISEFPLLNTILKKHGADGEEELGQAQFALLLQCVLQDLEDALSEKRVVLVQNIRIVDGSKLSRLLADEKQFSNVVEKILQEKQGGKDSSGVAQLVRSFLEKNGSELGLPPYEANEAVVLLYDSIFTEIGNNKTASAVDRDELFNLTKGILEKFAEQLEANPVYHGLAQ
ncbi:hypothetical protein L484_024582 [Morus notabilis]|uniref:EF-hand domain-containing protein n=1 Tax=Morus notabilis TaxID=981085 RepID=W9S6W9_9ROSA|nr:hypothetical protein L484_024582 [Morus notabilis]